MKNSYKRVEMDDLNNIALQNFQKYLQIPTVHPNIDYSECVSFLQTQAASINLPIKVIYLKPNKPVVIISWMGKNSELSSLLLNSHMDVVPVFEEHWRYKPFNAEIHDNKIYARGSQDMKCVGIQYLEAIRRLKLNGMECSRNIHICFVPEEEIGGEEGMKLFINTEEFKMLNVGIALDEGIANENDEMIMFYGEKCRWQFDIRCTGPTGHGSLLVKKTSGEKAAFILQNFYNFREEQKNLLDDHHVTIGSITTVNCTKISGGIQNNIIPSEITLTFDCRISTSSTPLKEFELMIQDWCQKAGPDCFIDYNFKEMETPNTKLDDSNKFWKTFKKATQELGVKIKPEINCATSDSRYLRQKGITAFGFSPINNTQKLLHSTDEYLGVGVFLRGIEIYYKIIYDIANISY